MILFGAFLTSYDSTRREERRQFMFDFKKSLKSRVLSLENRQYMDFDVFLCRKSDFELPAIVCLFDAAQRQKRRKFM